MGLTTAIAPTARPDMAAAVAEAEAHRRTWFRNRVLRAAYTDAWAELAAFAVVGPSLEVGCGCGNLDRTLPRCWKSDIIPLPWAHLAADALRLPIRSGALSNIVGTDVLHHLPRPLDFLAEAARALHPDGRLLLVEPFMSRVSYPLYRYLHHESADLRIDPRAESNQAAPTLLLWLRPDYLSCRVPELEIIHCRPRDAIIYPLSGGYSYPPLLPGFAQHWAWRIERRLHPLMPLIGFRLAIALRRRKGR